MTLDRYRPFDALAFDRPLDGVLRIVIDTPGRMNSVDAAKHRALAEVWPVIDQDPVTRVVLVRGADGNFSAGGDLDMVDDIIADEAVRARTMREARDLVLNLVDCSKPVVSAIDGVAVGAGLAVALLADVSVAARSARIVDGHTRLGVAAGDHAALVWPLLCGMAKAKHLLLTCDPVSGEEAERIGLVSMVADDDQVHDTAMGIAERLAAGSPAALAATKTSLNLWLRQAIPAFEASLAHEFLGFASADAREGLTALRERRSPAFPTVGEQDRS
ncbi:MAG: enoyl-CoA hydratase/isomerase family protein [Acidimicrobiales bacterium]|nr:enoyl-CoA hydratase/isomerase family protein [Acidimicrobiales bacterium]